MNTIEKNVEDAVRQGVSLVHVVSGVDLSYAKLPHTDLTHVELSFAKLIHANLGNATIFDDVIVQRNNNE